jgi:alkanesulfonate monooxygenase SsuD/methylene tetrahydromethanopterin reductase-like flavin-dependent oxidoreductase (luciferase family)
VNFDPMMTWPKPVQKPYPPIYVGGTFPHAARRAIRYADGWMPLAGLMGENADVFSIVPKARAMLAAEGRDPANFPISLTAAPEDLDLLKRYRDLGIERASVSLPAGDAAELLPILDRWAALIRQVSN